MNWPVRILPNMFDEKIGKKYLEDICSMDWQKCYCELFFSARPTCTTHQISYLSDSTLTFFANNFANIWQDIWKQISILKFGQFCIILRKNNRFQIIKEQEKIFTFKKFKKMSISMGKVMVLCLLISTRFLTFIFLWQTKALGAIAPLSVAFHFTKFQLFTFSTKQW